MSVTTLVIPGMSEDILTFAFAFLSWALLPTLRHPTSQTGPSSLAFHYDYTSNGNFISAHLSASGIKTNMDGPASSWCRVKPTLSSPYPVLVLVSVSVLVSVLADNLWQVRPICQQRMALRIRLVFSYLPLLHLIWLFHFPSL